MSTTLEAQIKEVLHAHLSAGIEPEPEKIDNFLQYISENYTGIGTNLHEFMRSKDELRRITTNERMQMEFSVQFDIDRLFIRSIRPDLALAEGELKLIIDAEVMMHHLNVRFSILFEQENEKWLITHTHYSRPDSTLNEGDTLMDALQARNAELEYEVEQRTAALNQSLEDLKAAQTQLIHQEKMASLGALTAGIAHEIKNPLNFITNFAGLSVELADELEQELDEGNDVTDLLIDIKHNAHAINKHGKRADAIVKDMMQHASQKAGKRKSIDLHELLNEYISLALHGKKVQYSDFECSIKRNFADQLPEIKVIPGELGRVFLNLLSNAFDALIDQPEPLVAISTSVVDKSVQIQFSDNGPGIPADQSNKIFEPFFTTKPAGEGTGLGLSLSYEIVTQGHSGTFKLADSELGGATFQVTLPM